MNYKFIKTKNINNQFDDTNVIVECEADSIDNVCQAFEDFLRGCGFHFKGHIEIVEDEE